MQEYIKENREHSKKGLERIKEYYLGDREKARFKDPPHEILEVQASKFILESIRAHKHHWNSSVYEVCVGCGIEILTKAIILSKCPEKFIEDPKRKYEQLKDILFSLFPKNLDEKTIKRIKQVLELIQFKRNDFAHLSFHRLSAYYETYQVFNVLDFLYSTYFPNSKILGKIKKFKEDTKVIRWMDFEEINLV